MPNPTIAVRATKIFIANRANIILVNMKDELIKNNHASTYQNHGNSKLNHYE